MTNVSAQMVKALREKTGAGMMDCKKALGETNGNIEEANPVMKAYLNLGIVPFILAKIILVGGGCLILWRHKKQKLAKVGIYLVFSYYFSLMGYFLYMSVFPVSV